MDESNSFLTAKENVADYTVWHSRVFPFERNRNIFLCRIEQEGKRRRGISLRRWEETSLVESKNEHKFTIPIAVFARRFSDASDVCPVSLTEILGTMCRDATK